jgi:hypothetical protein
VAWRKHPACRVYFSGSEVSAGVRTRHVENVRHEFHRLFFLRGAVLDREGHRAEAARYCQMFHALSGPDSAIWGEERRAR